MSKKNLLVLPVVRFVLQKLLKMPRKGNKKAEIKKQNKAITTRLMQISIVLDDFIYKNKPISAGEAEAFIEEVATYKAPCEKDPRSLQVIEKLTRCMRKIRNEEAQCGSNIQQENSHNNCNTTLMLIERNNEQDKNILEDLEATQITCPSPTYSINNIIEAENVHEQINSSRDKYISTENIDKLSDTINLNTNEHTNDVLEKSMTGLSLNDINVTQEQAACELFDSQSILASFTNFDSELMDLGNENGQDVEAYFKEIEISTMNLKTNHNEEKNNVESILDAKRNIKVKSNKTENTNAKQTKRKNVLIEDKPSNCKIQKNCPKKSTAADITIKNQNKVILNAKEETLESGKSHNSNIFALKDTKNVPKANIRQRKLRKTKGKPEVVVEDLSWIENIKYVREVTVEEYDPKLNNLGENFWDVFSLPPAWDETDFEY